MSSENPTKHIIQSLIVNLLITFMKGIAAFMTKSGAMLAETIHSFADCFNQGLLLLGVKQAQKPADKMHPLGYGRSVYFWSFMVAMLLFSLGGMFSIYEGIHKIKHPEPVENILWGLGVLGFSIILEGYATYSNIVELNNRRRTKGFYSFLKSTKDSDLVVIFGENFAAVIGLSFALIALLISYYTGNGKYDGVGSLLIGIILVCVAIFLAKELKPLLIGESADEEILQTVNTIVVKHPLIKEIISCITIQQGPGEVLLCAKIACKPNLTADEVCNVIDDFEQEIRLNCKEVKWIYIEPDLKGENSNLASII